MRKWWRYRILTEEFPPRKRIDRQPISQIAIAVTFSDRSREFNNSPPLPLSPSAILKRWQSFSNQAS
ncbi:MAG: hypothetical protein HC941_22405 [Microcoleus sp. SU_5_3]|nr:hypothetical protein [Microcoleus sp. SU_5_3]